MLAEERRAISAVFIEQYQTVRAAEGRGVQGERELRSLPFRDLSGKRRYEWAIRRRSFETLLRKVIEPLEASAARPLRILDVGSGVGWLSYRLSSRGHDLAAIDLMTNDFDGLGAHRGYDREFLSVQADFERLPFEDASVDIVVYNASFHYAWNYEATLGEALRVLAAPGRVVVMDTPIYRHPSSGVAMVRERKEAFEVEFGFPGDSLGSESYLTYDRLDLLARTFHLRWELFEPWYGARWWLKPWIARLRRSREPARFKLVVGWRDAEF